MLAEAPTAPAPPAPADPITRAPVEWSRPPGSLLDPNPKVAEWGCAGLSLIPLGSGRLKAVGPIGAGVDSAAVDSAIVAAVGSVRGRIAAAVEADERVKSARTRLARLRELETTTQAQLAEATQAAETATAQAREALHRADDPTAAERTAREEKTRCEQLRDRLRELAPLIDRADTAEHRTRQHVDAEARAQIRGEFVAKWIELTRPVADALGLVAAELIGVQKLLETELSAPLYGQSAV